MKFLFVHQNFPGQYLHLVRSLLKDNSRRDGTHEIVFMTEPNENYLVGVRKVTYAKPPEAGTVHQASMEFERAMRRAEAAAQGAAQLQRLGFMPDVIIGHHGWGEMLNLVDIFPAVPILGYFEFYYKTTGSDVNCDPEFPLPAEAFGAVRAKNAVNLLALALEQHGQVPTRWQLSTYPEWSHRWLHLLPEGVDLALCRPIPASRRKSLRVGSLTVNPRQRLLTYVARNLEPYRGFHTFMRALPAILQARPDVVVSIVGGDEVSYGAAHPHGPWREVLLAELQGKLDLSRVHFLGKIAYEQHLALLQRSDAHVYLSYPFVASWSLREALACGCAVIGGDTPTVSEFITDGANGLLVPFLDSARLADSVLHVLEEPKLAARLRAGARHYAEQHLDLETYLARYRALLEQMTGKPVHAPATTASPANAPVCAA